MRNLWSVLIVLVLFHLMVRGAQSELVKLVIHLYGSAKLTMKFLFSSYMLSASMVIGLLRLFWYLMSGGKKK